MSLDKVRLQQVLDNLLSNALKFTPSGGRIELAASMESNEVRVSVADTGAGISEGDKSRIFDEFYQVDDGGETITSGAGLGLTVSRTLITLMGGSLSVESPGVGQGSRFTVTLPVERIASPDQ